MTAKLVDSEGKVVRCSEKVFGQREVSGHRCQNVATVVRNEDRYSVQSEQPRPYCTIHDPVRCKELRNKKYEQQQAEANAKQARRATRKAGLIHRILECNDATAAEQLFDDISGYGYSIACGR